MEKLLSLLGLDCGNGGWVLAAAGVGFTSIGIWLANCKELSVPKEVDMVETSHCKDFSRLGDYYYRHTNGKVSQWKVLIEGTIQPCEPDQVLKASYHPDVEGVALVNGRVKKESIFRPQDMSWHDEKITVSEEESVSSISFMLVNKYDNNQSVRVEDIHRAAGFRDLLSSMTLSNYEEKDESKMLTFPLHKRELPLLLYPRQIFFKEWILKHGESITIYGWVKPLPGRSSSDEVIVMPLHVSPEPLDSMIHCVTDPGIKRIAMFHFIMGLIFCSGAIISFILKSNKK